MTTEQIELMPGVCLTAVRTDKFKSSYWSLRLLTPLKRETAALNALLPFVLRRGTARLPDITSFSAALDELYGGAIEPAVRKCGDMQCIGFEASFLDDACVPDGTNILEQAAALLGDLLLHPATKNGRLRQDYVLSERKNLIQMIRSSRNDKRQYARERLVEEMFAGEDYAVGRFGTVEQAEKIHVAKLFSQYQTLLEQSPIELFYCGSAPAKRVELAWREALMGLPRGMERYPVETDAHRPPERAPREFREQMDVAQGKMELGFQMRCIPPCWCSMPCSEAPPHPGCFCMCGKSCPYATMPVPHWSASRDWCWWPVGWIPPTLRPPKVKSWTSWPSSSGVNLPEKSSWPPERVWSAPCAPPKMSRAGCAPTGSWTGRQGSPST